MTEKGDGRNGSKYEIETRQKSTRYLIECYLRDDGNHKLNATEINRNKKMADNELESDMCDLVYSYYSKKASLEVSLDM